MNQDFLGGITRFGFGLEKFPKQFFNFVLEDLFDLILPEVPPQILRQPLTDWEDAAQVKLPEALSLHREGENV